MKEEARMNAVRCELVTGFARLEELSPYWRRWVSADPRATIFQRWEFARAFWKAYHSTVSLCSVAVHRGDEPVGILPLVRRGNAVEFLGTPESDYCDLLCEDGWGAQVLEAAVEFLLKSPMPWQSAVLMNVPSHSRIAEAIEGLRPETRRHLQLVYRCPCPAITVDPAQPGTWRELMDKEQLRRYDRKLKKLGPLAYRHFETREDARRHLDGFFHQHVARWAMSGVRSQFLQPHKRAFFEALIDEFDPSEHLRFGILELDSRPVAHHFGFRLGSTMTWYKPAFQVNYWDYCPGDVLIRHLLSYVRDAGLREFDFTIGDEQFKRRFANTIRSNSILYVERYPFRPRSLAMAAVRRVQDAVRRNPEWKTYLKEKSERLAGMASRYRELGGWSGLAGKALRWVWSREEKWFCVSPVVERGHVTALQVMEGKLEDIASLSIECQPPVPPAKLRQYRQWFKQGERLFLVKSQAGGVAVFWLGRHDWQMPVEAPALAVRECWTAPHRGEGTVPSEALRTLARHLGQEAFWIAYSAAEQTLGKAIAAAGFEPRCRLTSRVLRGKLRQTWEVVPSERENAAGQRPTEVAARACS